MKRLEREEDEKKEVGERFLERGQNEEIGGRWRRDENEEIGEGGGMRMKRLESEEE